MAEEPTEPKVSVATQLVKLAENGYTLGVTPDGEPYAIPKYGPPIVRLLRGGRQSLRAELASAFYQAAGSAASQSALADMLMVIEGRANQLDPVPLYLRVAEVKDLLVLDLGDATGRCVILRQTGWKVVDNPPVRFKRTSLTGALPEPVRGSDFAPLWNALNVAEKYRPLVLSVLVASLLPSIPHPVVLLTGEQGTGKSTATSRLASIIDPSPAQLRKAPRDADSWTTAAAGSWVVGLDNLSGISDWLSDSLCRASTGDGDVRRRLYTDGDLHVIAFRRCVLTNGIDVGALRGDLADRVVHLQLERIPDAARKLDETMTDQWRRDHPRVLGALLDLTVKVLELLPSVALTQMPRMADLARVMAAVDQVYKSDGLSTYLGLRTELAEDAATSDPVLVQIASAITSAFEGTSAELLAKISPALDDNGYTWKAPKEWPASAREMTTFMNRQAPILRQLGWRVERSDRTATRAKVLKWTLTPPSEDNQTPDDRRDAENGAAHAAHAAEPESSQVNGHAPGAAFAAASVRHHAPEVAHAASANGCRNHAATVAAPSAPPLNSTNGHSAATAAYAAGITPSLGSAG